MAVISTSKEKLMSDLKKMAESWAKTFLATALATYLAVGLDVNAIANEFVKKHHYSGKVDPRCYVHFGCFLDGKLHGVMQLGPSINKTASVNLVKDTHWNGYCELARVAFDDYLPANSESRCLSIMMKLLKKQAPHIEWVVSYADGAQCGDGGIYRASGFNLVGIKKNTSMWRMPDGTTECSLVFNPSFSSDGAGQKAKRLGKIGEFKTWSSSRYLNHIGAKPIDGFQLKYIYFLNEGYKRGRSSVRYTEIVK